jgi:hypothetical protein
MLAVCWGRVFSGQSERVLRLHSRALLGDWLLEVPPLRRRLLFAAGGERVPIMHARDVLAVGARGVRGLPWRELYQGGRCFCLRDVRPWGLGTQRRLVVHILRAGQLLRVCRGFHGGIMPTLRVWDVRDGRGGVLA